MIQAQVLKADTRIVLTYRADEHWATIDEDGGVIFPVGRVGVSADCTRTSAK
ncbi:hypothetical protein [Streptomyces sp. NPDC017991]|uniref:hypothetical protein n=1 Tax=Streptomyces sp. NPDC017991 TaxID=3365026 RepID=UPI0037B8594F